MRFFGLRPPKGVIVLFAVLMATVIGMAGPAAADVGPGQVAHIYMELDNRPGSSAAAGYSAFINSLRSTAGHAFRGGTYIAQRNAGGGALAQGFHGGFQRLPFASNYDGLSAAAGRGRGAMPISMNDVYSSVANPATTTAAALPPVHSPPPVP